MRILAILTLLLVLTVWVTPTSAIKNGEYDEANVHANVGAMILLPPDNILYPLCSGSLIHQQVFLTAGHCTDFVSLAQLDPSWVKVSFDSKIDFYQQYEGSNTLFDVAAILTHPNYHP
jgi:hypothetical protein